uniref:Biogenesis of lysosome-related organelles complex 1 subunit 1 n=1 Tax=Neobodo designis TaxID=312471 RepID=A0A7S1M3L5_NEODS|mmetsp:Transcript_33673/g.103937  ORF Transcript_33673/g.103937 Transcript_33673/m.103937 type:complete len:155 (+) Transcript_33673:32-496(+)
MASSSAPPSTPPTYAELEKAHHERNVRLKAASEAQFKATCQAATSAASAVAGETNRRSHELHQGAKRVEGELKELNHQTEQMHKRVQEWAAMLGKFNGALKELGDVANWATMIDRDVEDTVRVLDAVAVAKRRAAGLSTTSTGGTPTSTGAPKR